MEQRFSIYLNEIGLLNETASSSIIKKDDKASNKSFADSSFEYLKNYFDNLDEEQKNYMSLYIPTKFISISDKIKKAKLKSIIVQLLIRNRLIIFKYFLIWKKNISLFEITSNFYNTCKNNTMINIGNINNIKKNNLNKKQEMILENNKDIKDFEKYNNSVINSRENVLFNMTSKYSTNNRTIDKNNERNNNNNLNMDEYKDNVSAYNIVNIDRNVDVDNKNLTKTEEAERIKLINNQNHNNTISFANVLLKNNYSKKNNFKKKINVKNIKNININNKNKRNVALKSNNIINTNNNRLNINSYKTINTNNYRKQSHRSQYSTNNNNSSIRNSSVRNSSIRNSNKKKYNLHTSLEEKEILDLKECTFKPRINHPKKILKRTLSQNDINSSLIISKNINNNRQKKGDELQYIFEKLYQDSEKYRLSKEMKAMEMEHMISRKSPFMPNAQKNRKKMSLNKKRQKSEGNFERFEERQQEYLRKKNKRSAEIKNRINSDFEELCPFNPKITNDRGEYYQITKKEKINKKPVYIRLYEDNKDRQNYQMKKEIESMNKIMDLSNIINPKKNFNFQTINRLYENKEKRDIMKKTKKKVEEEEGITFKPNISESIYFRGVNGNFYERSQKLLNDRESFYEEENKKLNDSIKNSMEKKDYSKEERKAIIDNIINRLYNEPSNANKKSENNEKMKNYSSYCE